MLILVVRHISDLLLLRKTEACSVVEWVDVRNVYDGKKSQKRDSVKSGDAISLIFLFRVSGTGAVVRWCPRWLGSRSGCVLGLRE